MSWDGAKTSTERSSRRSRSAGSPIPFDLEGYAKRIHGRKLVQPFDGLPTLIWRCGLGHFLGPVLLGSVGIPGLGSLDGCL